MDRRRRVAVPDVESFDGNGLDVEGGPSKIDLYGRAVPSLPGCFSAKDDQKDGGDDDNGDVGNDVLRVLEWLRSFAEE